MKIYRVAAYVTAYKDPEALRTCIAAIQSQTYPVEKIFIVDNSPSTTVPLTSNQNSENIIIHLHPENIGIAGGLRLGIEWAVQKEYDFLWAFDQDSIPTTQCLSFLLKAYDQINPAQYRIGIIAPTAIDLKTNRIVEGAVFQHDHFIGCQPNNQVEPYECDAPITSGSLISMMAAKVVSPPREDLFIDGLDLDYGLRFKREGFHNFIIPHATLHHRFGNPMKVRFLLRQLYIQKYSALRHYYICRNYTYLETRYAEGWYRLTSCLRRIKYLIFTLIKIMLYDPEHKSIKIWACLLGTYHGFNGILYKAWK